MIDIERLLFVYNADSGLMNLLKDGAKKLLGISDCALCDLTHGVTGERAEFADCRRQLGVPIELLHRDELDDDQRSLIAGAYPCVLARTRDGTRMLLTPQVIERCGGSAEELRGKLHDHAAQLGLVLLDAGPVTAQPA